MEIKFYYSLKDLEDSGSYTGWQDFLKSWDLTYVDNVYSKELFKIIEDDFLENDLFILKVDVDPWTINARPSVTELKSTYKTEVQTFLRKIRSWLNKSGFRYDKLIALYKSQENNLLNKIESTVTNKFNDTPQTSPVLELVGDNFASTYAVTATAVDNGSVLSRLNEVRNSYTSLYAEWEEEFRAKFIL